MEMSCLSGRQNTRNFMQMWIQCKKSSTKRLYNADLMDEPVSFSENQTAQVEAETGERLIENYSEITEKS